MTASCIGGKEDSPTPQLPGAQENKHLIPGELKPEKNPRGEFSQQM